MPMHPDLEGDLGRVERIYSGYTSKCALLISCRGCNADLKRTYNWLQREPMSLPAANIVVLTDDPETAKHCRSQGRPDRQNIKRALRDLAAKSGEGTLQFLYVTGHSLGIPSKDAEFQRKTAQGYPRKAEVGLCAEDSEALQPSTASERLDEDYGCVRGSWMLSKVVGDSHPQSTFIALLDCCSDGVVMKLPYQFEMVPTAQCASSGVEPHKPVCDMFCLSSCSEAATAHASDQAEPCRPLARTIMPLFVSWRESAKEGKCSVAALMVVLRQKLQAHSSTEPQVPVLSCTRKILPGTGLPLDAPSVKWRKPVVSVEAALLAEDPGYYKNWGRTQDATDSTPLRPWDPAALASVTVDDTAAGAEWGEEEELDWEELEQQALEAVDWGSEYEDSDEFFLEEYDEEGDVVDFD